MTDALALDRSVGERTPREIPAYELIELFFFAYRDFVGDPDRVLGEYGFGRAHHRVLHFVARQRLLFPTAAGRDLASRLARLQTRRIRRALAEDVDGELEEAARRFLSLMTDSPGEAPMRADAGDAKPGA